MTQARIQNPALTVRGALDAAQQLAASAKHAGIPEATLAMVTLRASQINGCSVCVDIHTRELEHVGESSERIHLVAAWREAPYFNDAERAALALTEAATRLADRPDPSPTKSGTKPPATTPSPSWRPWWWRSRRLTRSTASTPPPGRSRATTWPASLRRPREPPPEQSSQRGERAVGPSPPRRVETPLAGAPLHRHLQTRGAPDDAHCRKRVILIRGARQLARAASESPRAACQPLAGELGSALSPRRLRGA